MKQQYHVKLKAEERQRVKKHIRGKKHAKAHNKTTPLQFFDYSIIVKELLFVFIYWSLLFYQFCRALSAAIPVRSAFVLLIRGGVKSILGTPITKETLLNPKIFSYLLQVTTLNAYQLEYSVRLVETRKQAQRRATANTANDVEKEYTSHKKRIF